MSATVPTGLDLETPDVLGDDASPRREAAASPSAAAPAPATVGRELGRAPSADPVVITGAALGLPGAEKLFGKVRGRLEGYGPMAS